MAIRIACECGHVTWAEPAAASAGAVDCAACGRRLAVPAAPPVIPGPPPTVAAYLPGPPAPKPPAGMAVASMVCGISSLPFGACLGFISLIVGTVAVILGAVSLAKRRGGKGMAIAGVATGGVGVLVGLLFLAIPLLMLGGIAATGRPTPMMLPTPADTMSTTKQPPRVLGGGEIATMLTGPLKRTANPARAKAELAKALAAYRRRSSDDLYLYECVQNFRLHLAYAGKAQPDDPEHRRMFERAGDELVDKVLTRYRRAGEFQKDGQWQKAIDAYRRVVALVPEPGHPLRRNVRKHMDYCKRRMQDK